MSEDVRAASRSIAETLGSIDDRCAYVRGLLALSATAVLARLREATGLASTSSPIDAWLEDCSRALSEVDALLLELRQAMFDVRAARGLSPDWGQHVQLESEARGTEIARAVSQIAACWKLVEQPLTSSSLSEIRRRLGWVFGIQELEQKVDWTRISAVATIPASGASDVEPAAGIELLKALLPHRSPVNEELYRRAARGSIRDRDIAFDVDGTLGDALARHSAREALTARPDAFDVESLDALAYQFTRVRLPYRGMQAALLGLRAAGNRLRIFTAAENLAGNLEAFLNDFPLLRIAFRIGDEDPLEPLDCSSRSSARSRGWRRWIS